MGGDKGSGGSRPGAKGREVGGDGICSGARFSAQENGNWEFNNCTFCI